MGQPLRDLRRADPDTLRALRLQREPAPGAAARRHPGGGPGRPTRTGWRSLPTRASSSSPPGRPTRWSGSRSSPTTSTEAPSRRTALPRPRTRGLARPDRRFRPPSRFHSGGERLHAPRARIPDLTWAEQPSGVSRPVPLHAPGRTTRSSPSRLPQPGGDRVAVCGTTLSTSSRRTNSSSATRVPAPPPGCPTER